MQVDRGKRNAPPTSHLVSNSRAEHLIEGGYVSNRALRVLHLHG